MSKNEFSIKTTWLMIICFVSFWWRLGWKLFTLLFEITCWIIPWISQEFWATSAQYSISKVFWCFQWIWNGNFGQRDSFHKRKQKHKISPGWKVYHFVTFDYWNLSLAVFFFLHKINKVILMLVDLSKTFSWLIMFIFNFS